MFVCVCVCAWVSESVCACVSESVCACVSESVCACVHACVCANETGMWWFVLCCTVQSPSIKQCSMLTEWHLLRHLDMPLKDHKL